MIVEPFILLPTTQIVNAFPCTRKAYLSNHFKGIQGDVNYALVLGNVIHYVFQAILEKMDFKSDSINTIIKTAIKGQLLLLYYLKKTEKEVEDDVRKGIKNITSWLDMLLLRKHHLS